LKFQKNWNFLENYFQYRWQKYILNSRHQTIARPCIKSINLIYAWCICDFKFLRFLKNGLSENPVVSIFLSCGLAKMLFNSLLISKEKVTYIFNCLHSS
jgi:hypothetical protein